MIRDGSNKKEKSEVNWVIEVMVMGDLIFFFFFLFQEGWVFRSRFIFVLCACVLDGEWENKIIKVLSLI